MFLTNRNVDLEASVVAILALGQLLLIITAGIDLAVEPLIATANIFGALWIREAVIVSGLVTIPTMSIASGLAGAGSGLLFVKGRIRHPFPQTLAMTIVACGIAAARSSCPAAKPSIEMRDSVRHLGSGRIGDVPFAVILVAVIAFVVHVLWNRTTWLQWIHALGGNAEGSRCVGIPVNRVLISVRFISDMATGTGSIVFSGQTNAA